MPINLDVEKQRAINSCACPRKKDETFSSPNCSVVDYVEPTSPHGTSVLFVKPLLVGCKKLMCYGYSYFCTCVNRKNLYTTYKL